MFLVWIPFFLKYLKRDDHPLDPSSPSLLSLFTFLVNAALDPFESLSFLSFPPFLQ